MNNKRHCLDVLYDELQTLQNHRRMYPRKNDWDRQKAIIRIKDKIMELNKSL